MFRMRTLILLSLGTLAIAAPMHQAFALEAASAQGQVRPAGEIDRQIALAESLVAQKRLAEAEETLLAVRAQARGSRRLELLLAQIRLWRGRLHEAATDFRALLARDAADAAAREGLATALYWLGDWPAAAKEYRQVLVTAPGNETARAALAEIEREAAGVGEVGMSLARDDQPYRRTRGHVVFTPPAESLTRWRVEAGSYHLESIAHDVSATAPFASVAVSTSFPRTGISIEAWVRGQKFPDDETKLLGGGAIRRSLLSPHSRLSLSVDQRELLYTTTSLNTHPYVTAATLRWDLEQPAGWYAAAYAEGLRYFDDNRGLALGGYAAVPVVRTPRVTLWLGGGASYRDTDETRYRLDTISSRPVPGGRFAYEYEGVYDPYWTPIETTEVRAAMALRWVIGGTALRLHADGGAGRESAIGFGPATGSSPFPLPGAGVFERNYNPWRAGFELTQPLGDSSSIVISYEHFVTAFYESDEAAIRFSRRF
jgi:tetratricopeptide (TPR) repeat protein